MAKSKMTSELLNIWSLTGQIAFGGMPTYQLGAKYPHDYVGAIDDVLAISSASRRLLIYLFWGLWFIISVENGSIKAFFGALAFGFRLFDYYPRCRSQCQKRMPLLICL
jgi:hypothetical protein